VLKSPKLDFFFVVEGYPALTVSDRVFFDPRTALTVGLKMQHPRQKVDSILQQNKKKKRKTKN